MGNNDNRLSRLIGLAIVEDEARGLSMHLKHVQRLNSPPDSVIAKRNLLVIDHDCSCSFHRYWITTIVCPKRASDKLDAADNGDVLLKRDFEGVRDHLP